MQRSPKSYLPWLAMATVLCLNSCGSGPSGNSIAEIKSAFHGEQNSRVTLRGVVTVENPNFGFFVVQDSSAGIRVQPVHSESVLLLGHRVEIRGLMAAGTAADTISDALVRDLGPAAMPKPISIAAKDLNSDDYDGRLVRLVGTAHMGLVDASGQLVVPLHVGGFEVLVRVMDDRGLSVDQYADADVELTGVASTGVDIRGNLTDFTILATNAGSIKLQRAPPDPASLSVRDLRALMSKAETPDHRVRLLGRIESAGEAQGLRLITSSASIRIADLDRFAAHAGEYLDLVAFVDHSYGEWSLTDVRPTVRASVATRSDQSALITTVEKLHALTSEVAGSERPVFLDCAVTYYDPVWQEAFVQDRTGGVYVSLHGSKLAESRPLRTGDHVRLRGLSGAGDFAPTVQSPSFEFVEHLEPPIPSPNPAEVIFSGQADSQWVELEGIVQGDGMEGNHPFLKLAYGSHNYRVVFPPSVKLTPDWINARVRVRGAAGTIFNGKRQVLGIQLFVQDLNQLVRLPDPVVLNVQPINRLLQFHPNEIPGHQVHVRGKVLVSHPQGPTWIKDDSGAVAIREHSEIVLAQGDVVDAVGFASAGAFAAEIHEGILTKRASGVPVTPVSVTPERALFQGVDGQLIRVEGRLISQYQTGREQTLLMRNGKATFTVRGAGNLPTYEIGEALRLFGICSVNAKRFRGVLAPNSFEVAVDSSASVEVLERAPWMNQQRAWRALLITSFLIALVLVWVMMLRRRVSGQTRLIEQKLIEVERLKEKAEAASDAKSQFLANMSHEIRTPMNGILGMTELAMQAESPAEQRECLSTIRSSGDALLAILNDLLDLSKIEAGKFEIEEAPFSLRELITESGKVFAFRIQEKDLQFESGVQDSLPDFLLGDQWRLRQILLNLLGNAVKFTDAGKIALRVTTKCEGEQVLLQFAVSDSGIGIPIEKQGQIFEAFRQADLNIARNYGGTGLGLSICLKLASLMGGKIELVSEVGKGSTFSVVLPLKIADNQKTATPEAETETSLSTFNILLAEDNLVNQRVASKLLQNQGHRVTIAANGKLAFEYFVNGEFDFILMDVQMPEMDGLEATREIRKQESTRNTRIPIIAMTAQTMKGDRDNCFAAGMDGFVSKPIRLPELWAALRTIEACLRR